MTNSFRPDGEAARYFGVYPAIVTDIVDPKNLGRIEVKFPFLGKEGEKVRAWATLLSIYAENGQGWEILPSVETQVVVAFEAGYLRRPYIVGAAWNGQEAMPQPPEKANNKRVLKTRSGSILEFDDTEEAAKISLSTSNGHKLVLDDGASEITLTHSNGCVIRFNAGGQIEVVANTTVEITAPSLNVHAGTSTFDGMINCTTLNASSGVSSPAYTQGQGNLW